MFIDDYLKRTWAEINLDNLYYNINQIKSNLSNETKIIAVVKADGYGHGDKYIANALVSCGINSFAVSNLAEALSLRNAGIDGEILILGFTPPKKCHILAEQDITQTIFSDEYAYSLHAQCDRPIKVHIKLDTGMGRIGFQENEMQSTVDEICDICALENFDVKGIYSHFSSADQLDAGSQFYTELQNLRFNLAVNTLKQRGLTFEKIHLQNSAGIAFTDCLYTHVRAGIIMYGVRPSDLPFPFPLRPVMELKSVVSMVKIIPKGTSVSYGRHFTAEEEMKIATVPIGYADGYPRLLSNRGRMLIHGQSARIVGAICMDQLMLDVSDIQTIKQGDIVTVVGRDGDEMITFDELANSIGTISYELMCLIGRRVPRVYLEDGKEIAVVDYTQ